MSGEDLERLRSRLGQLDDAPVHAHPSVLDEVHRGLVAELDNLARLADPPGEDPPAGGA